MLEAFKKHVGVKEAPREWSEVITDVIQKLLTQKIENDNRRELGYSYAAPASPEFAKCIDHTLLKPEATTEQVTKLCEEAVSYGFKSVCVRLNFVKQASELLQGSDVLVCCVVGFHEGTYSTEEKQTEATQALEAGAGELDMVLNYPILLERNYDGVYQELQTIRANAPADKATLKLILETSQLTDSHIIAATVLAYHAGFDFVKTSTGFFGHGATVEHVRLMRSAIEILQRDSPRKMLVKASGGIKTLDDAKKMLEAGAARLGVSAGVAIVDEARHGVGGNGQDSGY